ncbi:MAG: YcxB family protein [Dehalococcoidia bacterium]|nr:MAG: YcxB family protein [Dehalococcoidia bacterium]UCG83997.1 MAG: YcxB family protein [Dehalococcoidia bacterium]
MDIEYENSMDDILALNLYHHQQAPSARRTRMLLHYGPPVILVIIFLAQVSIIGGSLVTGLPWLFFAGIWVIFVPYSLRRAMKKKVARMVLENQDGGITGQHKLSLKSDSVTDQTGSGKTKTRWADVPKIVLTSSYLYIYISDTSAHIIPKRAFESETKFREFVDTAMRYYRAVVG